MLLIAFAVVVGGLLMFLKDITEYVVKVVQYRSIVEERLPSLEEKMMKLESQKEKLNDNVNMLTNVIIDSVETSNLINATLDEVYKQQVKIFELSSDISSLFSNLDDTGNYDQIYKSYKILSEDLKDQISEYQKNIEKIQKSKNNSISNFSEMDFDL